MAVNRPNGVDDMARFQPIATRNTCVTCGTAIKLACLRQQLRPCCPMNGSINASTAEKRVVGRADNGIHDFLCNIPLIKFNNTFVNLHLNW